MTASLTNQTKNRYVAGSGGEVFYGWLFWFTRSSASTGPSLSNATKHTGSITNQTKH